MIARNGKKWNTAPERNFEEYQRSRGMGLVQNVNLPFGAWVFQLDFAHPFELGWDVDYEVDGPYHGSDIQQAKDSWKDALKNRQGLKVVHIPAILTNKKWWPYLDEMLPKALLSVSPTVYVIA